MKSIKSSHFRTWNQHLSVVKLDANYTNWLID